MTKTLLASLCLAAACALPAHATTVVDTGTPDGQAVGSLAFDSADWVAGQISFASDSTIDAIQGHVLAGTAGETFDISLFANDGGVGPGSLLYTTTATFAGDGWNGVSGLTGWNVAGGASYWVEFEVQGGDTLDGTALIDLGAPSALAHTVSTSDSGFHYDSSPLSFGLRVDASTVSAVPAPASGALMLAGLAWLSLLAFARRAR